MKPYLQTLIVNDVLYRYGVAINNLSFGQALHAFKQGCAIGRELISVTPQDKTWIPSQEDLFANDWSILIDSGFSPEYPNTLQEFEILSTKVPQEDQYTMIE
jgi:hypothetical protein